ncbi:MAG: HAMP domain-containing histidine kinase [Flavobacteriales bacterium]|nr:HAMP domain-containing histidine kinase [Flavobacteriales bacterium]
MKLFEKTRNTYLIYSVFIFIISSSIIYYTLREIVTNKQDEKLMWDKELIAKKIKYEDPLPIFEVDDYKSKNPPKDTLYFKDTLMYHIVNNKEKYELYRQLTSIETLQGKTYKIITRNSMVRSQDAILAITVSVGIVVFLLILTVYVVNTNIMRRVWLPFYKNLETLKNFSVEANKPIDLQSSDIDEFQELNNSLSKLTNKINSDFNNLKEFTENASHEMQTPLAIMQTKSEILLQSENLEKSQITQINAIYQSVQRLSKLNKTLLLLSKIENRQFKDLEKIKINEVIERQLEIFEDFIENKKLNVEMKSTMDTIIKVNPLLFDVVISNLISNAIKHNNEGGEIFIQTTDLFISVSNSGVPPNMNSASLFERFKKESTASNSFGLGLAIVKKICDNYNWKIMHSFAEDQHNISIYF